MKKFLLTAAAVSVSAPAFAGGLTPAPAEPVVPAPVVSVAPVSDWTGGYAGLQLGYGDAALDIADDDLEAGDFEINDGGVVGGVHAGYLWDFGRWVAGGEAVWNAANIGDDDDDDTVVEEGTLDSIARLQFKGGYDAGRTLIYGTLGAAHASAEFDGDDVSDTGWTAGLGVDYKVRENISVGGGVYYHRFDDFDDRGFDAEATTVEADVSFHF
ncbi:outer membrane protein [Tranquillimonas alkanivorans]|uniref:Opacity protein n=1 Tax=Tranquillimonas alkanivorans TaxID=441119 RepID=A0A1I5NHA4_9RHOB|nr:outer membrane beta-barrel protein [Tranquillimonas alkanivorans]SFP20601.1 Opacity protein [Tranquillimonas alkanivorans]